MASGHVSARSGGSNSLPPLSPNYQATQLLTPRYLERITIDNPHYHDHLFHSMAATAHSSQLNPLQRRTQTMGDRHFHLQKDIPVEQSYARTALKLSEVRPWDQIVCRPLSSREVIDKEVHLPFPQEHPYTSHISRFSVFPDTKPHPPPSSPRQPTTVTTTDVDTSTQTPLRGSPQGVYYVTQKACEKGVRVERRHLSAPPVKVVDLYSRQLWDLPRSRQHQRSLTYPAPTLQYAPPTPLTAPPLSPASHLALDTIHKILTRTTAYSEHFTPPPLATGSGAMLHYPLNTSRLHCRPWTTESRGKYSKGVLVPESGYPNIPNFASDTTMSDIIEKEELLYAAVNETEIENSPSETKQQTSNSQPPCHDDDKRQSSQLPEEGFANLVLSKSNKASLNEGFEIRSNPVLSKSNKASSNEALVFEKHSNQVLSKSNKASSNEALVFEKHSNQVLSKSNEPSSTEAMRELPSAPHTPQPVTGKVVTISEDKNESSDALNNGIIKTKVDNSTQTEDEYFTTLTPSHPHTTFNLATCLPSVLQEQDRLRKDRGTQNDFNPGILYHTTYTNTYTLPQIGTANKPPTAKTAPPIKTAPTINIALPHSRETSPRKGRRDLLQQGSYDDARYRPASAYEAGVNERGDLPLPRQRPYTTQVYTPRTADKTRRLMSLYNGFDRVEVLRQFHKEFPEHVPDLREHSIREGKRHSFLGHHAYYFH